MSLDGHRDHHALSTAKRVRTLGPEVFEDFQLDQSARSLDDLPALSD